MCIYIYTYVCIYIYIYIDIGGDEITGQGGQAAPVRASQLCRATRTQGSCLIRRRRGHPGVVLPLVVSISANHQEGARFELSPIRNVPN